MNIEFHYYITYWISKKAGFNSSDAEIISYASQSVDESIISYKITTPVHTYITEKTQDYSIWSETVRDSIYLPFHFIPGGDSKSPGNRIDGRPNPYNVVPDSECAREILVSALKTKNLYRIGIALHAYADTWAHQNFSGLNESWNLLNSSFFLPPAGHAQALKQPDSISKIWTDPRLLPEYSLIINRKRFVQAIKKIYKYLRTFHKLPFDDVDSVIQNFEKIIGRPGEFHHDVRIQNLMIDETIPEFNRLKWIQESGIRDEYPLDERFTKGYDKLLWIKTKLPKQFGFSKTHEVNSSNDFFNSSLYNFNEAVKNHKEVTAKLIRF